MHYNKSELEKIFQKVDWYLEIQPQLQRYTSEYALLKTEEEKQQRSNERDELIQIVMELMEEDKIKFGENILKYFDKQRKEIDTIVIHHSSRPASTSLDFLNLMHLINLYIPVFVTRTDLHEKGIFSGHEYNGKMTFAAYHYVIYPDGNVINLLSDDEIGWHCGNWDYNCRSIGICFLDDLEESKPTQAAISSANGIIKKYKPKEILGHREIKPTTTCPGNLFLGEDGWKKDLYLF